MHGWVATSELLHYKEMVLGFSKTRWRDVGISKSCSGGAWNNDAEVRIDDDGGTKLRGSKCVHSR